MSCQIKIRVFATPTEQSHNYYYVNGFLVICIECEAGLAFGDHLKYQGGGVQGEYAVVMKWDESKESTEEEGYWDIGIKEFFGTESSDEQLLSLGLGRDYLETAHKCFGACLQKRREWLTHGNSIEAQEILPEDSYWVHKDKLKGAEEDQGGYWLKVDPDYEDISRPMDISYVSGDVPGNMKFYL